MKVLFIDDNDDFSTLYSILKKNGISYKITGVLSDEINNTILDYKPDLIMIKLAKNSPRIIKNVSKHDFLSVILLIKEVEYKKRSKEVIESILAGAIDYLLIPEKSDIIDESKEKIILSKLKVSSRANNSDSTIKEGKEPIKKTIYNQSRKKILLIGASTGGPQTLEYILSKLPKNFPSPILIVQHMPASFTKSLANRIDQKSEIRVVEAVGGEDLQDGVAFIAPGGFHMELFADVEGQEGQIRLNQEPLELGVRPNVNRLFKSAAKIFKENTVGLILTGMGKDGLEGCKIIKSYGGTVIAESEESSVIYGMPKEVVDAGLADEVVDLKDIPKALIQVCEV